jgi:hypothetical protein
MSSTGCRARRVLETAGGPGREADRSPTTCSQTRPPCGNLAVVGCHPAHEADGDERMRSWTDVDGRPQTVLKTAGLASVVVRKCSPEIRSEMHDSLVACQSSPSSASLAVILAVNDDARTLLIPMFSFSISCARSGSSAERPGAASQWTCRHRARHRRRDGGNLVLPDHPSRRVAADRNRRESSARTAAG